MISLDDAAAIALSLPEVVEGTRSGTRTWAVNGKTFAWERRFSKADVKRFGDVGPPSGDILAVLVDDLEEKMAVLAAGRRGVFTIPHFDNYAAVLVELHRATRKVVRDVLVDGWLSVAPATLAGEHAELLR
jgi:hypothetical protein